MLLLSLAALNGVAQTSLTMQQCMQYAVEHNHDVRRATIELDSHKASKAEAVGSFLPSVDGGIGVQYNFGRAIDPQTNGYTNVSTFNNGYSLQASLPLFDGLGRVHALRAAKAGVLMGHSALRQAQNETALSVLNAFTNVVYHERLVEMAKERSSETTLLLKQARLLEEVGRKSAADVAQVEAQKAGADYDLLHQQSLHASALLELKKAMSFPMHDTLVLVLPSVGCCDGKTDRHSVGDTIGSHYLPVGLNAELQASHYQVLASRHKWHQARASLFPSLSLSAGLNTSYYHTLHSSGGQSFSSQLSNNLGEFVGATLTIPLFNRLRTVNAIRKARNDYRMAVESYEQKQLEIEKLSREAWQDWQGYLRQAVQLTHKVEADSLAYELTRRQFEEGLATAIDLHTTSAELRNSKALLLQCQLMAIVKEQLVNYYRGETIWSL